MYGCVNYQLTERFGKTNMNIWNKTGSAILNTTKTKTNIFTLNIKK